MLPMSFTVSFALLILLKIGLIYSSNALSVFKFGITCKFSGKMGIVFRRFSQRP
jgi:hypothetical protein